MTVHVQCPRKRTPRQPTTMLSTPIPSDSDTQRNLQPRRDALSYSIDRLSRRNEIVLKSSMRVLDHRFRHRWTAVNSGGDVRITAHEAGAGAGVEAALHLGSSFVPDAFFVQLPLRAQDLETTFNRIGEELIQTRDLQRSNALRVPRDDEVFHLQRWPSDTFLHAEHSLTLATLLSARPCSVVTLQGRSALPMDLCRAFMKELMGNGLLRPSTEATTLSSTHAYGRSRTSWSSPAVAPSGLLARIRARLGILPIGPR